MINILETSALQTVLTRSYIHPVVAAVKCRNLFYDMPASGEHKNECVRHIKDITNQKSREQNIRKRPNPKLKCEAGYYKKYTDKS